MFTLEEELNLVIEPQISPFCGPLCFTRSLKSAFGNVIANGSFGLVDTGKKKLLITCYHVWEDFEKSRLECPDLKMCVFLNRNTPVGASGVVLDFQPIDQDKHLDLVTFDIEPLLSECRNRKFYPLNESPVRRIKKGDQFVFIGYQGALRSTTVEYVQFGNMIYAVEVTSIDGLVFHAELSRARTIYKDQLELIKPLEQHKGISGSPCFWVRQNRLPQLVGFARSEYMNCLWFTHVHCLNPDGTINRMAD